MELRQVSYSLDLWCGQVVLRCLQAGYHDHLCKTCSIVQGGQQHETLNGYWDVAGVAPAAVVTTVAHRVAAEAATSAAEEASHGEAEVQEAAALTDDAPADPAESSRPADRIKKRTAGAESGTIGVCKLHTCMFSISSSAFGSLSSCIRCLSYLSCCYSIPPE